MAPGFGSHLLIVLLATRPHFFALPIGGAYAGASAVGCRLTLLQTTLLGFIAGGGWASGQLLNDVMDREADAIDAPDRPAVRGLLPAKPTIAFAFTFGLALLYLLTQLTPEGWKLGLLSMFLILTYNLAKALPGIGNLSHGALLGCAAIIGAAVAAPNLTVLTLVQRTLPMALFVALWAALYLQGNYEKDILGDAHAGYRTLAHILGPQRSALLRLVVTLACAASFPAFVSGWPYLAVGLLGCGCVLFSATKTAFDSTKNSALASYRWTVHGAVFGMIALGGPALTPWVFAAFLSISTLLTEVAFRTSSNP